MKFRSEGKWTYSSVFSPQMYLTIGSAGKPQIPFQKQAVYQTCLQRECFCLENHPERKSQKLIRVGAYLFLLANS